MAVKRDTLLQVPFINSKSFRLFQGQPVVDAVMLCSTAVCRTCSNAE